MIGFWWIQLTSQPALETMECVENEPGQDHGHQGRPDEPDSDCHADGRRDPYAYRRRQALHLVLVRQAEDHPGAEKTHAGSNALNDTAHIGLHLDSDNDKKSRAKRNQHVRAHAPRLVLVFALESDKSS